MSGEAFPFQSLPEYLVQKVLSYLSFDQVAQMRIVCRSMNYACQMRLNHGFRAVERFHTRCMKEIKDAMPRRESVRRNHAFARHCDILTAIETRISLLSMTFSKYMDLDLCCFIPGKVIDEIYRVIRLVKEDKNPPKTVKVLQELRDISSMAMEHFDEHVAPQFNLSLGGYPVGLSFSNPNKFLSSAAMVLSTPSVAPSSTSTACPAESRGRTNPARMLRLIRNSAKAAKTTLSDQKKLNVKLVELERSLAMQDAVIKAQRDRIREQQTLIAAQNDKLKDTNEALTKMGQKLLQLECRMNDEDGITGARRKRSAPDVDEYKEHSGSGDEFGAPSAKRSALMKTNDGDFPDTE